MKLARHTRNIKNKLNYFGEILEDIGCYNSLSEEDAKNLKNLINSFVQLLKERRDLGYQIQSFDNSITKLDTLNEEAINIIDDIENAEKEEKKLSYDIILIKQEQENIKQDKEKLEVANKCTNIFSFIIIAGIITSIVVLSSYSLIKNVSILMPLTILSFLLILAVTLVYLIRKKLHFELALNSKKQAKLMNILNKKTVIYSHYLNFLNFAYKKYKIKNAKMLRTNIKKYPSYKNTIFRYDSLGKILEETHKNLENFINIKNINIKNNSIEVFAKSINLESKISYSKKIEAKRLIAEEKLKEMEEDFVKIQEELAIFNENDTTKENVAKRIITYYLKELEDINKASNLKEEDDIFEELEELEDFE